MAVPTSTIANEDKTSLSWRLVWGVVALAGIALVTGILLSFSYYWLGINFFFAGIMLLISLMMKKYELRNLGLLLVFSLAVAIMVGIFTRQFLSSNPQVLPIAQNSGLSLFTVSFLIGIGAVILFVVIPFLLLVGIATAGILKWHKDNGIISFFDAYEHMLTDILGIFRLWVVVEDGMIKGDRKSIKYLERWGGPGWLTIYPGQVVVLHKWGKVSRAVGRGTILLEPREQIKAILPLTTKGGVNTIENILTIDRIPLTIKVVHAVQLEPAAGTKKRLQQEITEARRQLGNPENKEERAKIMRHLSQTEIQLQSLGGVEADWAKQLQQEITEARKQLQALEEKLEEAAKRLKAAQAWLQALENDKLIGDDYDQCYESVAKLAAARAGSDIWASMKSIIASSLRDVMLSYYFDELFDVSTNNKNLNIAEIENLIFEKTKDVGVNKGVQLRIVDIVEIIFPQEISQKIAREVTTLLDARIEQTKTRAKELAAPSKARAMQVESDAESASIITKAKAEEVASYHQAKTQITLAEAEAQAARVKAAARADYYRQIIRTLRQENQSDDTIKAVIQNLTIEIAVEDQWERLLQLAARHLQREDTERMLAETTLTRNLDSTKIE